MRSILCLYILLAIGINLISISVASAEYKIKETQIRELPGTEIREIGIDKDYIRGVVVTVHIQAKKRWLEKDSSVSVYCTLSKDSKKFGILSFNDKVEEDAGALYSVNIPFSPWIPYHGEDIKVRFEIIEITREDVLKEIISTVSDQTIKYISFAPKATIAFNVVKPITDLIIKLREVNNRAILKAERAFYVPEETIRGILPLRYQHYIVFDNTEKGRHGTTIYEYIKQNCEIDSDGYLCDKETKDLYRGTTYIVFRFEPKRKLLHDLAELKGQDFYNYFHIGEDFAKSRNWGGVDGVGFELSRSIFENKNLQSTDRAFIMREYYTMALMHGYSEEKPGWLSPRYLENLLAKYPDIIGKEKDLFLSSFKDTSELITAIDTGILGYKFSSILKQYNIDIMDPTSIFLNKSQLSWKGVDPDKLIEFSQELQFLSKTKPIMPIVEADPSYWITLSGKLGIDFSEIYKPQE